MPLSSASFAALMNAIILASSVNSLFVTPLRGAIPEALRSGDHTWLRMAMLRMYGISAIYGLIVFVVLAVTGERLFEIWYRGAVDPQASELLGAGLYFVVLSIEVTNFTYLSNVGLLPAASRAMLIKGVCSAIAVLLVSYLGYFYLAFWVLLVANIVFALIPHMTMMIAASSQATQDEHER